MQESSPSTQESPQSNDVWLGLVLRLQSGTPLEGWTQVVSSQQAAVFYSEREQAYLKLFYEWRWRDRLRRWLLPTNSRYRRFVKQTHWLRQRQLPAPAILAAGRSQAVGYVATAAFPGLGLGTFFANYLRDLRRQPELLPFKRRVVEELGQLVARLHNAGVAHGDLRPNNILLDCYSPTPRFCLIDNERNQRLPLRFWPRARIKNLVQLNMLWPEDLSASYRWRFLKAYVSHLEQSLDGRQLARRVQQLTQQRLQGKSRGGYRQAGSGPGPQPDLQRLGASPP